MHYSLRQVLHVPVSWRTPTTGIKVKQMSKKSNSMSTYHLIETCVFFISLFSPVVLLRLSHKLSFLSMHVTVQEFFRASFHTHPHVPSAKPCTEVRMCSLPVALCMCFLVQPRSVSCFDGAVGVCGKWFCVYTWRTLLKHSGVTCILFRWADRKPLWSVWFPVR